MNRIKTIPVLLTLLLFLSSGVFAENFLSKNTTAFAEPDFLPVDEAFIFNQIATDKGMTVTWKIATDYYLYKDRIKIASDKASITLGEPVFSQEGEQKDDPNFGLVTVFHGFLEMHIPIQWQGGSPSESIDFRIGYQGCADAGLCYPPQTRIATVFRQTSPVVPSPSSVNTLSNPTNSIPSSSIPTKNNPIDTSTLDTATGIFGFLEAASLGAIIATFFLLGLGLTFTPCVLPMIPIITAVISGQKERNFKNTLLLSVSYVLGMSITYAMAGVATGLIGASANVQAQLQSPGILIFFSGLFVLLSLSMFGAYELQLPAFLRDRLNTQSQQLSGGKLGSVFFIGALSALIVSPCVSAPLAGALIYISTTEDAVLGGISLLALGLGMGAPLILIALGGDKYLPKAGKWMETTKKVFGFMLLGLALWLLERLLPASIMMLSWGVLLAFSAVHLGAFDPATSGLARTIKTITLLMFFYALLLLVSAFTGGNHPLMPLSESQTSNTASQEQPHTPFAIIKTSEELNRELAVGQSLGRITMLDYYADWCISCKVMEKEVFSAPEVASMLAELHLVQANVTDINTETTGLLTRFDLFGPPTILFFDEKGSEITASRIQGEIKKEAFLKVLSTLSESTKRRTQQSYEPASFLIQ